MDIYIHSERFIGKIICLGFASKSSGLGVGD